MNSRRVYFLIITIVIILIAGVIIPLSLIKNNSIALSRIYYEIDYKGNVQNFETIVEKSELFEYDAYCKYRDSWGEGPLNSSDYGYYSNIDRELIESLQLKIDKEKKKFHFYMGDHYYFIYSVEVTNESLIYLTYNNNNIIKAEYSNHTEIFTSERIGNLFKWEGNWYLNFTQIPLAPNISNTIMLNNTILVKMKLEYHYSCGWACAGDVSMEQFLCFNSNLQTIFVYFPFSSHAIT
jgi:hypothetical protein